MLRADGRHGGTTTATVAPSMAWVTRTLRECGMRRAEIRAVMETSDPEVVRRHLELHRELLEERLAQRRRALLRVERFLAGPATERPDPPEKRTVVARLPGDVLRLGNNNRPGRAEP